MFKQEDLLEEEEGIKLERSSSEIQIRRDQNAPLSDEEGIADYSEDSDSDSEEHTEALGQIIRNRPVASSLAAFPALVDGIGFGLLSFSQLLSTLGMTPRTFN